MKKRWIIVFFEQDQYIDGRLVVTRQARWIMGSDPDSTESRAVGPDTDSSAFLFRGEMDSDTLVMGSLVVSPTELLFTGEVVDKRTLAWRNEISPGGGPWQPIRTCRLRPSN